MINRLTDISVEKITKLFLGLWDSSETTKEALSSNSTSGGPKLHQMDVND